MYMYMCMYIYIYVCVFIFSYLHSGFNCGGDARRPRCLCGGETLGQFADHPCGSIRNVIWEFLYIGGPPGGPYLILLFGVHVSCP